MPATYVTTTIISSPNMRTAACVIAIFTLDTGVANKYAIAPLSTCRAIKCVATVTQKIVNMIINNRL